MRSKNLPRYFLFLIAVLLFPAGSVWAQDETNMRSITSQDFQAQRPQGVGKGGVATKTTTKSTGAKRKKNIAVISNSKRRYNLVKKIASKTVAKTTNKAIVATKQTTPITFRTEEIGVTFWRLRPKNDDEDDAPTFSVKVNNQIENWTAERVSSTTRFRKGDKVRFTIESSRSGYLYIVNREFYTDGTSGQANIIFPTLKTRNGGDNRVAAGSLIEIPSSEVQFPYYNVNPQHADYAGEELILIITEDNLSGFQVASKAQPVVPAMLEKWLADWSAEVDIFDAEDGVGIAYTEAEAQAATVSSRALTQEEPLPQTIYRVRAAVNAPLVVPFQMQAAP